MNNFLDLLGNISLIESMLFFLFGGSMEYSGTANWLTIKKLLNLDKKNWTPEMSREAEQKALFYIFIGVLLFVQIILIAII